MIAEGSDTVVNLGDASVNQSICSNDSEGVRISKVDRMIIELQKRIVQEIAMNTPYGWDRITVNMEIDNVDGDLVSSESSEVWIGDKAEELDLSYEASEYFEELRSEMLAHDKENDAWTICNLDINNDGSYKFSFSYDDSPKLATLRNKY